MQKHKLYKDANDHKTVEKVRTDKHGPFETEPYMIGYLLLALMPFGETTKICK